MKVRWIQAAIAFTCAFAGTVGAAEQWARVYGGADCEFVYAVRATSDGGYVVAGSTSSFGAGGADAWIAKIDSTGVMEWQKAIGGPYHETAYAIEETADGYVLAGHTSSFAVGLYDAWMVKLDAAGTVKWQRAFGGTGWERAESIQQTADGGYALAGWTTSWGSGSYDAWCVRVNKNGKVVWQQTYGGAGDDIVRAARLTSDGSLVLAGHTSSYGAGRWDGWCVKLDSTGAILWQRAIGGSANERVAGLDLAADGGIVLAGWTSSFGSDGYDGWCVKLDSLGALKWQKAYASSGAVFIYSIRQTVDGGYVVAGDVVSTTGVFDDGWCAKLDAGGNIQWQYRYAGGEDTDDRFRSVAQTSDKGYVLAGYTSSFGAGCADAFVLKLAASGKVCTRLTKTPAGATARNSNAASAPAKSSATITDAEARLTAAKSTVSDAQSTTVCN